MECYRPSEKSDFRIFLTLSLLLSTDIFGRDVIICTDQFGYCPRNYSNGKPNKYIINCFNEKINRMTLSLKAGSPFVA